MNDQDKAFARQALERKQLTIEQVEQIRAEVDRTGRPFKDVAAARGLLAAPVPPTPPSKPMPILYVALLAGSFVIFSGLLIATLAMRSRLINDDEMVLEKARSQAESHRKGAEARQGYNRSLVSARETEARQQLEKARAAMARVDAMLQSGTLPPELVPALNEAFVAYNMYLKVLPDDAAVCVERARTHELRRNYDLAIADLEHAAALQPELQAALKARVAKLRELMARKPR